MVGVVSLLVALTLSLLITRIAAMASMFTGTSSEAVQIPSCARASSGVG